MSKLLVLMMMLSSQFSNAKAIIYADFVQGEVIAKLKKGVQKSNLKAFNIQRSFDTKLGEFVIVNSDNKSTESLLSDLKTHHDIFEYVEPNYIYHTKDIDRGDKMVSPKSNSSDPLFTKLWGLRNTGDNEPQSSRGENSSDTGVAGSDINAIRAWELTKGSKSVKIAVIDTGIDYQHEDLKDNIWVNEKEKNGIAGVDDDGNGYIDDIHGYDFANDDADPMDGNGHGTHCAGTIAGVHDNGVGVKGVMHETELVAIKFLTDQGSGTIEGALRAIDYAIKMNVDIMSNSWGGSGRSQALFDIIKEAKDAGIVFVAAAGNSGSDNDIRPHYPSNFDVDNVIAVAATNYNDQLASFSCFGSETVDIAAPGRNILSTVPGNEYQVFSGTSMATPHIAGIVGLYLAYNGKSDTTEQIKNKIINTGVYNPLYGRKIASGARVDTVNLLKNINPHRPAKPDNSMWQTQAVEVFESDHPYIPSTTIEKTYHIPGAKFIRVVVDKLDLELGYDKLFISDKHQVQVDILNGMSMENVKSDYVDGDTITVKFTSDITINRWGFLITSLEVIY